MFSDLTRWAYQRQGHRIHSLQMYLAQPPTSGQQIPATALPACSAPLGGMLCAHNIPAPSYKQSDAVLCSAVSATLTSQQDLKHLKNVMQDPTERIHSSSKKLSSQKELMGVDTIWSKQQLKSNIKWNQGGSCTYCSRLTACSTFHHHPSQSKKDRVNACTMLRKYKALDKLKETITHFPFWFMQLLHQRKRSFVSQNNPGHPTFPTATTLMSHVQHQEKLHCSSPCCETRSTIWGHIPTISRTTVLSQSLMTHLGRMCYKHWECMWEKTKS